MQQLNLFQQDFLVAKEKVKKASDHDPLLVEFLDKYKLKNAMDAIDYFGYPVAFRQAFKKWKASKC